jgi:predicted nucleic acid-binding protein
MSDRFFLDSNILVYAYDAHEPKKRITAQSLLKEGIRQESAVISTQVTGEFFTIVTRKIPAPLSTDEAWEIVKILGTLPVLQVDLAMVHRAIETHKQYQISYWDSLILAAAERAGCDRVMTEDLQHGGRYHGILAVDPFAQP